MIVTTKNPKGTQKIARMLARKVILEKRETAKIICLEGNLGAGKTTFTQGFAQALGIKARVLSPTFILMKIYELNLKPNPPAGRQSLPPRYLVHIDCYRFDSPKDLAHLGFKELLKDKDAIILIEWADRVRKIIPKDALWIGFKQGKKPNERLVELKIKNEKEKTETKKLKRF